MNRILLCFIPILIFSCTKTQTDMNFKQDAFIEIFDQKILEILDPEAKLEILSTGHAWTEGPLWLEETQTLIFTDIPNNAIYQVKDGESSIYIKPSG